MQKYFDLSTQEVFKIKEIDKKKAVAFTGHRKLGLDFEVEYLKEVILEAISRGFDTFLVGMALGFDSQSYKILENFRKSYKIKLVACIPCRNQQKMFNEVDKKEYVRMVNSADTVILLSNEYTPYCMNKRNRFMVDNCSLLISYLNTNKGGTKNTVDYAKKVGVKIINICDK